MRHINQMFYMEGTEAELAGLAAPPSIGTMFRCTDGKKLVYWWDGAVWLQATMGANMVWQDIDFPLIVRVAAAGTPSLVAIQGNILAPQWAVNDAVSCEGQEMVHSWAEASAVYWHIHLFTNGFQFSSVDTPYCALSLGVSISPFSAFPHA